MEEKNTGRIQGSELGESVVGLDRVCRPRPSQTLFSADASADSRDVQLNLCSSYRLTETIKIQCLDICVQCPIFTCWSELSCALSQIGLSVFVQMLTVLMTAANQHPLEPHRERGCKLHKPHQPVLDPASRPVFCTLPYNRKMEMAGWLFVQVLCNTSIPFTVITPHGTQA